MKIKHFRTDIIDTRNWFDYGTNKYFLKTRKAWNRIHAFCATRLTIYYWFIKLVYMKSKKSTVGSFEAKTHLARLLDEVAAGGDVTITRRGRPVARIIAVAEHAAASRASVVEKLSQIRAGIKGTVTIRDLINEGRKR